MIERLVDTEKEHGLSVTYILTMITPVDIKATFTREIPADGLYRVHMEIIDAINIEFDVLVFDTDTGRFSRVASVYDMETYPVGRELADYNGIAYHRTRAGVIEYTQLRDAIAFENVTKQRLQILAQAWSTVLDKFSGTGVFEASSFIMR